MSETLQQWIDRKILEKYTGPQLKVIVKAIRDAYACID